MLYHAVPEVPFFVRHLRDDSNRETPALGSAAHHYSGSETQLYKGVEMRLCRAEDQNFPDLPRLAFDYAVQYVVQCVYAWNLSAAASRLLIAPLDLREQYRHGDPVLAARGRFCDERRT
jgi:hypothetical protein